MVRWGRGRGGRVGDQRDTVNNFPHSQVRENHFAQWSARKSFRAVECAKIISRTGVRENHFAQWSARKSFRALESAKIISRSGVRKSFRALESAKIISRTRVVIGRKLAAY